MLATCRTCGAHVPDDVAVVVTIDGKRVPFCSSACAEAERASEGPVALPELPRRILVPVDGSGPSVRAVEMAAALARASGGEITLLHAVDLRTLRALGAVSGVSAAVRLGMDVGEMEAAIEADASAVFARERRVCEEAGVKHSSAIVYEPASTAVVQAAEGADLVVMGSRGMGAVAGSFLGSVSHRVIGSSRTPVLVVH